MAHPAELAAPDLYRRMSPPERLLIKSLYGYPAPDSPENQARAALIQAYVVGSRNATLVGGFSWLALAMTTLFVIAPPGNSWRGPLALSAVVWFAVVLVLWRNLRWMPILKYFSRASPTQDQGPEREGA